MMTCFWHFVFECFVSKMMAMIWRRTSQTLLLVCRHNKLMESQQTTYSLNLILIWKFLVVWILWDVNRGDYFCIKSPMLMLINGGFLKKIVSQIWTCSIYLHKNTGAHNFATIQFTWIQLICNNCVLSQQSSAEFCLGLLLSPSS